MGFSESPPGDPPDVAPEDPFILPLTYQGTEATLSARPLRKLGLPARSPFQGIPAVPDLQARDLLDRSDVSVAKATRRLLG